MSAEFDTLKTRIWNDLAATNYKVIYISIFNQRVRALSDRINLFTAAVASTSVGGWAAWESVPWLWGSLIAASQFINIAKPYIPRIRDYELFHELQLSYQERAFELDLLWSQMSFGDLTFEEIKDTYRTIKRKYFDHSKNFVKVRLDKDRDISQKVNEEWKLFLYQTYGVKK